MTLVVDDDECGEILDVNLPHGLHAELWELEDVDFFNVVLGENGGGTADGTEVKTAVSLARASDGAGSITLGEHDH